MSYVNLAMIFKQGGFNATAGTPNYLRTLNPVRTDWTEVTLGGLTVGNIELVKDFEDTTDIQGGNWVYYACLGGALNTAIAAGATSITVESLGDPTSPTNSGASQSDLLAGDYIIISDGVNADLMSVSTVTYNPAPNTWTLALTSAPSGSGSSILNAYGVGATVARLQFSGYLLARNTRTTNLDGKYIVQVHGFGTRYTNVLCNADIVSQDCADSIFKLCNSYTATLPEITVAQSNFASANSVLGTSQSKNTSVMKVLSDLTKTENSKDANVNYAFWIDRVRQAHHTTMPGSNTSVPNGNVGNPGTTPATPTYTIHVVNGSTYGDQLGPLDTKDMDMSGIVNTALVQGGKKSSKQALSIIVQDTTSQNAWGYWEGTFSNPDLTDEATAAQWGAGQLCISAYPKTSAKATMTTTSARLTCRDLLAVTGFSDGSQLQFNPAQIKYVADDKTRNITAELDLEQMRPDIGSIMTAGANQHAIRVTRSLPEPPNLDSSFVVSGCTITTSGLTATIAAGVVSYEGTQYSIAQSSFTLGSNDVQVLGAQLSGTSLGGTLPCYVELPHLIALSKIHANNIYNVTRPTTQGSPITVTAQTSFGGIPLFRVTSFAGAITGTDDLRVFGGVGTNNLQAPTYGAPTVTGGSVSNVVSSQGLSEDVTVSATFTNIPTDGSCNRVLWYYRTHGTTNWSIWGETSVAGLPAPAASQLLSFTFQGLQNGTAYDFAAAYIPVRGDTAGAIGTLYTNYSTGTVTISPSALPGISGTTATASAVSLANYVVGATTFGVDLSLTLTYTAPQMNIQQINISTLVHGSTLIPLGGAGGAGGGGVAAGNTVTAIPASGSAFTVHLNSLAVGEQLDVYAELIGYDGSVVLVGGGASFITIPAQTINNTAKPLMPAGATVSATSITETILDTALKGVSAYQYYTPSVEVSFTLGDANNPTSSAWGHQYVLGIRAYTTTAPTDYTTYQPFPQSTSLPFGNGAAVTLISGTVTPGSAVDIAFWIIDGQGNRTNCTQLAANYAIPGIKEIPPIQGPIIGIGHLIGGTGLSVGGDILDPTHNGNLLHTVSSYGTQQAVNATGDILNVEFPSGQIQSDGSMTNVDGATSHQSFAISSGQAIAVTATIAKQATGANGGIFIGTPGGYTINPGSGYFLYRQTDGNFACTKFLNGASQGDVFNVPIPGGDDTNYHTYRFTITPDANNTIEGSCDTLIESGSDSTITLPATMAVTLYTAGSAGKVLHYSASATPQHYGTLPPRVSPIIIPPWEALPGDLIPLANSVLTARHFKGGNTSDTGAMVDSNSDLLHTRHSPGVQSIVNSSGQGQQTDFASVYESEPGTQFAGYQIVPGFSGNFGMAWEKAGVAYDTSAAPLVIEITGWGQQGGGTPSIGLFVNADTNTPSGAGGSGDPTNGYLVWWSNTTLSILRKTSAGYTTIGSSLATQTISNANDHHLKVVVQKLWNGGLLIQAWADNSTLAATAYEASPIRLTGYVGLRTYNSPFCMRECIIRQSSIAGEIQFPRPRKNLVVNGNNCNGQGTVAPSIFGWTNLYGAASVISSGTYTNGYLSLNVGGAGGAGVWQSVPLTPGKTYTCIALAYAATNAQAAIWIGTTAISTNFGGSSVVPSGVPGQFYTNGASNYHPGGDGNNLAIGALSSNGWEVLAGTFTVPTGTAIQNGALLIRNMGTGGSVYFQGVMLVEGNLLQDYVDHEPNFGGIDLSIHPGPSRLPIGHHAGTVQNRQSLHVSCGGQMPYMSGANTLYFPSHVIFFRPDGTYCRVSGGTSFTYANAWNIIWLNWASNGIGTLVSAAYSDSNYNAYCNDATKEVIGFINADSGTNIFHSSWVNADHVSSLQGTFQKTGSGTVTALSSTFLNRQGSITNVGGVPSSLPYTANNSSITLNMPAVTVTFSDQSTESVPASNSIVFGGLNASTTYYVCVWIDTSTWTWNGAYSSSAFTGTQVIQNASGDGKVPVFINSTCSTTSSSTGTPGTGGGVGPKCPSVDQEIETLEHGFILAGELRIGDHLRDPYSGWNAIEKLEIRDDEILSLETEEETVRVNATHLVVDDKGEWVYVRDLKTGDKIARYPGGTMEVKGVTSLGAGQYAAILCENNRYVLGHHFGHNTTY